MKLPKLGARGFGLIEVLITMGIVGLTAWVMISLQKTNLANQKHGHVVNSAQQLQIRMQQLLTDNQSWYQTVLHNPSMACLKQDASGAFPDCSGAGGTFDLHDGVPEATPGTKKSIFRSLATDGSDGIITPGEAPYGFDNDGGPCTEFKQVGNPICPMAYYITWKPQCASTPCYNPPIEIRAKLIYKPGDSSNEVVLNTTKYSIGYATPPEVPKPFVRSASSLTLNFKLVHAEAAGGMSGGGACPILPAMNPRPMDKSVPGSPVSGDPFNLVGSAGGNLTLKKPGSYKCTGMGVGFAVRGFQIELDVNGSPVGSGVGFAPEWLQGTASFEAIFTTTAPDVPIVLKQGCEVASGGNFGLGLPITPYTNPAIYATLVCGLIN